MNRKEIIILASALLIVALLGVSGYIFYRSFTTPQSEFLRGGLPREGEKNPQGFPCTPQRGMAAGNAEPADENCFFGQVIGIETDTLTLRAIDGSEAAFQITSTTEYFDQGITSSEGLEMGVMTGVYYEDSGQGLTALGISQDLRPIQAGDLGDFPCSPQPGAAASEAENCFYGTLIVVDEDSLTLQATDGNETTFQITDDTEFFGQNLAALEDLQLNFMTIINFEDTGDGLIALAIAQMGGGKRPSAP